MAAFGITKTLAALNAGGMDWWKVRRLGTTPDDAFYSFGDLADGKVSVDSIDVKTGRQASKGHGFAIAAEAKVLGTSNAGLLQLLVALSNERLSHAIKAIDEDAGYFAGELGFGWDFDSSADYNGNRFLAIKAQRNIIPVHASLFDLDNFFTLVDPTTAQQDQGDALNPLLPGSPVSAGASNFEIRAYGESNWETLGEFRKAIIKASLNQYMDGENMNRSAKSVTLSLEADMMQTGTEKNKMDTILTGSPDFRVTLADGLKFTFVDVGGCKLKYDHPANMQEPAFIHVVADGMLTVQEFVDIIS